MSPTASRRAASTALVAALLALYAVPPSASAEPATRRAANFTQGSILPIVRGPAGFRNDHAIGAPSLNPTRMSVHVDLRPDIALVEQTVTVDNTGTAVRTTVGMRYTPGDSPSIPIVSFKPLGVTGWYAGRRLDDEAVRLDRTADGYEISLTARFEPGQSTFSLLVALQTVGETERDGGRVPSGTNPSRVALMNAFSALDWSTDSEAVAPEVTTHVTASGGVRLAGIRADRWTEHALRHGDAWMWHELPALVLTYDSEPGTLRASTLDELYKQARRALGQRPTGHVAIPADATEAMRPGGEAGPPPLDPDRARRAMIVPGLGLILLLLVGYVSQRRKEARA